MPKKTSPMRAKAQIEFLSGLLKKENMSQTEFAQKMGLAQSHVSRLLRGERILSPEAHSRLAEIFGLTINDVIMGLNPFLDKIPSSAKNAKSELPYPSLADFIERQGQRLGITEQEAEFLGGARFLGSTITEGMPLDDLFWERYLLFWRKFLLERDLLDIKAKMDANPELARRVVSGEWPEDPSDKKK